MSGWQYGIIPWKPHFFPLCVEYDTYVAFHSLSVLNSAAKVFLLPSSPSFPSDLCGMQLFLYFRLKGVEEAKFGKKKFSSAAYQCDQTAHFSLATGMAKIRQLQHTSLHQAHCMQCDQITFITEIWHLDVIN